MRQTHCKHGHALMGDNLYISPKGARGCRACRSAHAVASHKKSPELRKQYGRNWMRKQRAEHPERLKDYNLRADYGIDWETYQEKLNCQNHCCMICKRVMASPHVDHDHETKQVRDLLCRECNSALGFIREDVEIAKAVVAYLERWKPDAAS